LKDQEVLLGEEKVQLQDHIELLCSQQRAVSLGDPMFAMLEQQKLAQMERLTCV